MASISKPLSVPRSAVIYITAGALTIVWCGIWFFYLNNNPPSTNTPFYWCFGFLLTGVMLALIGLGIGRISRIERPAQPPAPPPVQTPPVAAHVEQPFYEELPAFAVDNLAATSPIRLNGEATSVAHGLQPAETT